MGRRYPKIGDMVAICIRNRGADLGAPFDRRAMHTLRSMFHLTVGSAYLVMGMGIFGSTLIALVRDDTGKPNWLPVGLFDFGAQALPAGWEFSVTDARAASGVSDPPKGWVAKWGYPELVRNPLHTDLLIERDPTAIEIFDREVIAAEARATKTSDDGQ